MLWVVSCIPYIHTYYIHTELHAVQVCSVFASADCFSYLGVGVEVEDEVMMRMYLSCLAFSLSLTFSFSLEQASQLAIRCV